MNQGILAMEIAAFIAFITASMYAFLRYRKTKDITNLWLLITIALFLFGLFTLAKILGTILGLDVLGPIEELLLIVGATALTCALSSYKKERIFARDCKDGKLKEKDGKRCEEIEKWLNGI